MNTCSKKKNQLLLGKNNLNYVKALRDQKAPFWLMLSIIGIIVYVLIDVLLAFLRPGYSLLHNAESDYGRGPYFWVMDINFVIRCLFSLALARALLLRFPASLRIKQASYFLATWAIASGLLAFFADNPVGYTKIWSGSIHLLLAFIAFIAIVIAMFLLIRALPEMDIGQPAASLAIFLTVVALISLLLTGRAGGRIHGLGGLYERIFLGSVLLWELILAAALLKAKIKTPKRPAGAEK